MEDWTERVGYETDARTDYSSTIGGHYVRVWQLHVPGRPDHWAYTAHSPKTGWMVSGNMFPWTAERAMNYVVVIIALEAFSRVLTESDRKLYDENDLYRFQSF